MRPLSPHLSVYRFTYTMVLSILHRMTGVLLARRALRPIDEIVTRARRMRVKS